jgi:hypothetical protein
MTTLTISDTADDDNNDMYVVIEDLSEGFFKARSPERKFVLLRVSSGPSLRVSWYKNYIQYRSEISRRMKDCGVYTFCELWIKQIGSEQVARKSPDNLMEPVFPRNPRISVFEFFEPNTDNMAKELKKAQGGLTPMSFLDRLINAKVMMNAIAALHEARVVHTDLKPENLMLIPNDNPHVDAKYNVKLIDMDFAVQVDKTAPWDGQVGYTGTPGWCSPEHKKSQIPLLASDVFTCGLILYQLLAGRQPMDAVDEYDYWRVIESKSIPKPTLLGRMGDLDDPGNTLIVEEIIHRCLDPDPVKRPTASEVNKALNNEEEEGPETDSKGSSAGSAGVTGGGTEPQPVRGCTDPTAENYNPEATEGDGSCTYPPEEGGIQGKLLLVDASGHQLVIGAETKVGKTLVQQFGEDHKFWHLEQFTLNKDSWGFWQVVPDENPPNDTLLNGKKITEPVRLGLDDQLAVGRGEKGIVKLPLTCREG